MFNEYVEKFRNKDISLRQLCIYANKYDNEVFELTSFLNEYNIDINERLYYIINDLHDIVRCKYCNNKAIWSGRIKDGYKDICGSKDCRSKQLADSHKGKTLISSNRDDIFIKQQADILLVTDAIIKDLVKYDKHIELIDNPRILSYLDSRYTDSFSRLETVQRIKLGIENKPSCPTCGNPVQWIGKKSKLYTKYCSNKCSAQNKETTTKKKATQLEHWGTENCYDSEKYRQHLKDTIGVEYHTQRKDVIEKKIKTWKKKYGVSYASQSEAVKQKTWETFKSHTTFASSKEEIQLYNYLITFYPDIKHHYKSEKYPFNCDFYIPSEDLYIEYQGSMFHNKRAFLGSKEDYDELQLLKEKSNNRKSIIGKASRYESIIQTWSIGDVKKRNIAKDNKVNYLEIFRYNSLEEAYAQIQLYLKFKHCEQLYNEPFEKLQAYYDYFKHINITTIENASYHFSSNIIKYFQYKNFFRHEIDLYVNDPIIRRKLIQNRCKYLNKKESELTIDELLTGFKKSGIYYGYSHFDPRWTNWFVNKYQLKTIYDPCGGWGHHLLGMLKCDKIIYNDYSKSTVESIQRLKDYFNIENLDVHYGDATKYIPEEVDGWFMCPPYYNLEHYECGDFDDLETYKKFLNDIFNIWKNSGSKVFGIIIREDMIDYINENYTEVYDIKVSKSHLINNKSTIEKFYIFMK